MLYRVSVQNFGSIHSKQVLDFTISGKVETEANRQLIGPAGLRVPRICVILGANASGKTTALRAIGYMIDFVYRSALYSPELPLLLNTFSDHTSFSQPIILSIEFTADWIGGNELPYRYTFTSTHSPGAKRRRVERELLEVRASTQWSTLIDRNLTEVAFRREFGRFGGKVPKSALERHNASVISLLLQYVSNDRLIDAIRYTLNSVQANFNFWIRNVNSMFATANTYAHDSNALKALNERIRKADLGIRGVKVEEVKMSDPSDPKRYSLLFEHSGLQHPLHDTFESHGTMNFVSLFPHIHKALQTGGLALMDEMDSDLHPELLQSVASWFVDLSINKKGAQLLMTCNNPTILDHLRKEEIFFSKKDDAGRTALYSLKDIPGVRRDANFQREYLAGRYGAVPNIG